MVNSIDLKGFCAPLAMLPGLSSFVILMQNFVQFSGFNGCPYCMEQGKTVKTSARGHTYAYPFNRGNLLKSYETERTYENTLQHAYDSHKSKGYSWFMFIPGFEIIKGISVDYMHSVLSGSPKCS